MASRIEFYFDFGSPNAYLAHKVVPSIEKRIGARFALKPALLGGVYKATNNRSPSEAFAQIPAKMAYDRKELYRFVGHHSLDTFRMNPNFPINTLGMMRGAWAAKRLDVFEPYVEAVYSGMWEQELQMGDEAVFRAVLADAQLPTDELIELSQRPEIKAELIECTRELVDRGGFGSPTFFVGEEMFFGKDRLRDVEEEFVSQRERSSPSREPSVGTAERP